MFVYMYVCTYICAADTRPHICVNACVCVMHVIKFTH